MGVLEYSAAAKAASSKKIFQVFFRILQHFFFLRILSFMKTVQRLLWCFTSFS